MFLYLLNFSLPFHLVWISVFGVAFLYAGSLWFLFIVKVPPCGWSWTSGLSSFPGGNLASVFWWVKLDLFSLECNEVSSSEFWGVYGFGVTLGSLYFNSRGYVPVLLENWLGMSCSETCWLLGGAWFQCRYGGFWMSFCWLMVPGVRRFLVFSSFGFKAPASGFQCYSYSGLKISLSILQYW